MRGAILDKLQNNCSVFCLVLEKQISSTYVIYFRSLQIFKWTGGRQPETFLFKTCIIVLIGDYIETMYEVVKLRRFLNF